MWRYGYANLFGWSRSIKKDVKIEPTPSTTVMRLNTQTNRLASSMNKDKAESAVGGEGPILFYSTTDAFGEFSNFALYPIKVKGKVWPTSEHYFQAQKFSDKSHQNKIRKAKSPMDAACLGRSRKVPIRKDWDKVRLSVMDLAVREKFTQHAELRELLISTGERKLVEHATRDSYWGDGGDGRGENHLGRILMNIRKQFQAES